ncbi:MAG: hypothetical protein K8S55_00985 [Phycisphaerae bacterium]|nr:hypothetical protein [Phycisphaerae bacterium]
MIQTVKILRFVSLCGLVVAAGFLAGCDANANKVNLDKSPAPNSDDDFTLGIEQQDASGGVWKKVRITSGHKLKLDKRPFRIVFFFKDKSSMLVQASFSPKILRQAAAGKNVNELFRPNSGIAEKNLNPNSELYVRDEPEYHNWLCFGPRTHRFDAGPDGYVEAEGGVLCRRTVKNLICDGKEIPIEKCPHDAIYMVFVKTAQSAGSNERIEKQRDWLKLEFVK